MIESYKTSVRQNDPNPQFNEVTIFKVKTNEFNKIFLKITLFQVKNNEISRIGHVFIGQKTSSIHWQHILKQVRRQVMFK
jgi:hypothetical protein